MTKSVKATRMNKTATISPCEQFRYRLGRRWGEGAPLLFIMLNPSTADAQKDDRTIRRCIGFARDHAFDALEVVNLWAFRATHPNVLRAAGYPIGPDNDRHIGEAIDQAEAVCLAWGGNADTATGRARASAVIRMVTSRGKAPMALRCSGWVPHHPLMLPAKLRLVAYQQLVTESGAR